MNISVRSIFNFVLSSFLFIGIIFYLPITRGFQGDPIEFGYNIQELFFRYGTAVLFCLSLLLDPVRKSNMKMYAFFLIYLIFTSISIGFDMQSRRHMLNIFTGIVFIKTIVEYYDFKSIKSHIWTLFSVLVANLVLGIFQLCGKDPIFQQINPIIAKGVIEMIGFMKVKAHLGTLAAMISPLLFIVSPWTVLVCIPLIYFSGSSAGASAFVVTTGFMFYCMLSKQKNGLLIFWSIAVALLIGLFAYVLLYDAPGGQFSERFKVWFPAMSDVLRRSPFFGMGIGSFAGSGYQTTQVGHSNLNWVWAHNEYLQMLYETGVFGLMIIIYWIKDMVVRFRQRNDYKSQAFMASFVSVCMVSFLHFPFHIGRHVIPCLFIIAINEAYFSQVKNEI